MLPNAKPWGKGTRIVCIDDSIDTGTQFGLYLKHSDYRGEYIYHISYAMYLRASGPNPDIIICDLDMPIQDGFSVHDDLLDRGFSGNFILCTGRADILDETWIGTPPMDVIIKPVLHETFLEKMKCLI